MDLRKHSTGKSSLFDLDSLREWGESGGDATRVALEGTNADESVAVKIFPSSDLMPEEFLDPLEGRGVERLEGVPQRLRNMLAYAQHLTTEGGQEGGFTTVGDRALLQEAMTGHEGGGMHDMGADTTDNTLGCGFYDVFYEGCGTTAMCFYDSIPCSASEPFYDFYAGSGEEGRYLPHPPQVEYEEIFSAADGRPGLRSEKANVVWSGMRMEGDSLVPTSRQAPSIVMELPDMPASNATVTLELHTMGNYTPAVTVLGEEVVAPANEEQYALDGDLVTLTTYIFAYAGDVLRLKFAPPRGMDLSGMTFALRGVKVSSIVDNYAPVAEEMQVFMPADPSGGVSTIELRGHDDECGELRYMVTSLPTEGKVYLCTCDSIWTTAITSVPTEVPGPCHRLVYEPQAGMPLPGADINTPFDSLHYQVVDPQGAASLAARVRLYVSPAGDDCDAPPCAAPSSGKPGLALSFNGDTSVLMLGESRALAEAPADGLSLEARFKLQGAAAGVLLAKEESYELGWSGADGLSCMVMTAAGPAVAMSGTNYDDRFWHHAVCAYDAHEAELSLFVDGALAGFLKLETPPPPAERMGVPMPVPLAFAEGARVTAGANADLEERSFFFGYLDEVRIWDFALSPKQVVAMMWQEEEVTGAETGLLAYLPFNDMSEGFSAGTMAWDKSATMSNAVFGLGNGDGTYYPEYVASTATFGDYARGAEDSFKTITLHGGDTGGGVTYFISTLPRKGELFQMGEDGLPGAKIETSPFPVTANKSQVVFVPGENGYGSPYDIFKYQTYDGEQFSYKQGVVVSIDPLNDPPVATPQLVETTVGTPIGIHLAAEDFDFDTLSYHISRLPAKGSLYFADVNMQKYGRPLTTLNRPLPGSQNLVYEPLAVGNDPAVDEPYDSFGFVARDNVTTSREASVRISIPNRGCVVKPVAGDAGYSLEFDGEDDVLHLGRASAYVDLSDLFSVELWFRTNAMPGETGVTLVRLQHFRLGWSKRHGLSMRSSSDGSAAASFQSFNDGQWHYVSGTFNRTHVGLEVDGVEFPAAEAAPNGTSFQDVLAVGYDPARPVEGYFNGVLDELKIWSDARTTFAGSHGYDPGFTTQGMPMARGYGVVVEEADPALAAYWRFNDAPSHTVTDMVTGAASSLGSGGTNQTEWLVSSIVVGNAFNTTEKEDVSMVLPCASEHASTLDAVIVALPLNGHLYYTVDGDSKLFLIDSVPTILKERKVVYNSGTMGAGRLDNFAGGDGAEWGNFRYVCIGDLQDTIDTVTATMMYDDSLAEAGRRRRSLLHADGVARNGASSLRSFSRHLLNGHEGEEEEMTVTTNSNGATDPVPPELPATMDELLDPVPPMGTQSLLEAAAAANFYAMDGLQGLEPAPPPVIAAPPPLETMAPPPPPLPPTPPPPYVFPNHMQAVAAQAVVEQMLGDVFPMAGGGATMGRPYITSISFRVKAPGMTMEHIALPDSEFRLRSAVGAAASSAANVRSSAVSIDSIVPAVDSLKITVTVSFPAGIASVLEMAEGFGLLLENDAASVFQEVATMFGVEAFSVEEISTRRVAAQVEAGAGLLEGDCYQVSQVQTMVLGVAHLNQFPNALDEDDAEGDDDSDDSDDGRQVLTITLAYGENSPLDILLPAGDADGDEVIVRLTYVTLRGQLSRTTASNRTAVRGTRLLEIDESLYDENSVVEPVDGNFVVTYQPPPNAIGSPFDQFGYTVSDGTTKTKEVLVLIVIDDSQMPAPSPVAGNAGYALLFDGDKDVVYLGNMTEFGLELREMTVACWVRTSALASESRMTLFTAGPMMLRWTKVTGFQLVVDHMVVISTHAMYNDGLWHYVAAEIHGEVVHLYMDDQMFTGRMAPGRLEMAETSMYIGAAASGRPETYFNGLVDELVLLDHANGQMLVDMANDPKEADMEGMVGYYRFNTALEDTVVNEVMGMPHGRLGTDAGDESQPKWTPSTIVLSNKLSTMEDTVLVFTLEGVSNYDKVPKLHIVTVPKFGVLKVAGGNTLSRGSSAQADSVLTYMPYYNYYGPDEFTYTVDDCCAPSSAPVRVSITVLTIEEAPEAMEVEPVVVDFQSPEPVEVSLAATDGSRFFAGTFYISHLPKFGILYQGAENGMLFGRISEANSALTNCVAGPPEYSCNYTQASSAAFGENTKPLTHTSVMYMPLLNLEGTVDSFGFVAVDEGNITSQDVEVTLTPTDQGLNNPAFTPVINKAGLSVLFDGTPEHSVATLGHAEDLMIDSTMQVSMYFKTLAAYNQMTLLEVGQFAISWTKQRGLQFRAGDTTIASYMLLNDGAWHHVAASWNGTAATFAIDSEHVGTKEGAGPWRVAPRRMLAGHEGHAEENETMGTPIVLGSTSAMMRGETQDLDLPWFSGQVDEIHIGPMGNFTGIFHMDEPLGANLNNSLTGEMLGMLGKAGDMTGPTRVASTLVLDVEVIRMMEDSTRMVPLQAISMDASTPDLQYMVLSLPARGALHELHADGSPGRRITRVPRTVPGSAVVFRPALHEFSGEDEIYSEFTYAAMTVPLLSMASAPMTVAFMVHQQNDSPRLNESTFVLELEENDVVAFSCMEAMPTDVETDAFVFVITTLPNMGTLYQADGKTPFTAAGSVVNHPNGTVVYVPPVNAKGFPLATIGFVAVDEQHLATEEATVSFMVSGNDALMFNSTADPLLVDAAAELQLTNAFTVDAWMRTSSLSESVYTLVNTALTSVQTDADLDVDLFTTKVLWPQYMSVISEANLTLRRWHHVAAVYAVSGEPSSHEPNYFSGRYLYVDGMLVGGHAAAPSGISPGEPEMLTIGATGRGESIFPGQLDAVRIWAKGLEQFEVIESKEARKIPPTHVMAPFLVASWDFDRVVEDMTMSSVGDYVALLQDAAPSVDKVHIPTVSLPQEIVDSLTMVTASTGTAGYAMMFDGMDDKAVWEFGDDFDADDWRAGLRVDLWFKSSGANSAGALVSAGLMSVHWTRGMGLGLHFGVSSLNSNMEFNDGSWHHLMATVAYVPSGANVPMMQDNSPGMDIEQPGTWNLTLSVDNMTITGMATHEALFTPPTLSLGASTHYGWTQFGSLYRGMLDEVMVTSAGKESTYAYYSFDEAWGPALLDHSGSQPNATATLSGDPLWVFSSAPVETVFKYTIDEDESVVIQLTGQDGDGDHLYAYVASLPEHGTVLNMDGTPVAPHPLVAGSLPARVTSPDNRVVYVGGADRFGNVMFAYSMGDGFERSDDGVILINVLPVNDPPVINPPLSEVFTTRHTPVHVDIANDDDVDGPFPLKYFITSLPTGGLLFEAAEMQKETPFPLDHLYAEVDAAAGLVYVPDDNGVGEAYDVFGYVVSDGEYTSQETTITVHVDARTGNSKPRAGHGGGSLYFQDSRVDVPLSLQDVSEFTVELWMRSSNGQGGFQVLAGFGAARLCMPFKGGVLFELGESRVLNLTTLTDGGWHHVAASSTGSRMTLLVDGSEAPTTALVGSSGVFSVDLVSLGGASSGESFSYTGQMDEFRLWNFGRSSDAVRETMHTLLTGMESGLVLYVPFDKRSTQGGEIYDEQLNFDTHDGFVAAGEPRQMVSNAPLPYYPIVTPEDQPVLVPLVGTDLEHETELRFYITSLPAKGVTLGNAGEEILMVPYQLTGAEVTYVPPLHSCGMRFDEIGYAVFDGEEISDEAYVTINVIPVPDAPRLVLMNMPVSVSSSNSHGVALLLQVEDFDLFHDCPREVDWFVEKALAEPTGDHTLKISTLPEVGTLHQSPDGVAIGAPIHNVDTPLEFTFVDNRTGTLSGYVVYVPVEDVSRGYPSRATEREDYEVYIGFFATDSSMPGTQEGLVDIVVTQSDVVEDPRDITAPAARAAFSLAGQALYMDGEDDEVVVNMRQLDQSSDFSVELWMKQSGPVVTDTTLIELVQVFRIFYSKVAGLSFSVFTEEVPAGLTLGSMEMLNDGAWHHVTGTWTHFTKEVRFYVDGELAAARGFPGAAGEGGMIPYSTIMHIGSSYEGATATHFNGLIDEVRLWRKRLTVEDVNEFMMSSLSGEEEGLLLYYQFDQKEMFLGATIQNAAALAWDQADPAFGYGARFSGDDSPIYASSTAPLTMLTQHTREDVAVLIELSGTDIDFDHLQFVVTRMPPNGTLFSGNHAIEIVPYLLPANNLRYLNKPHHYGTDEFGFVVDDGTVMTPQATVRVVVEPVNDAPVGHLMGEVLVPVDSIVPVRLSAVDRDRTDSLQFILTTLPAYGAVWMTEDGVTPVERVTSAGTLLKYVSNDTRSVIVIYSSLAIDMIVDTRTALRTDPQNYFGFRVQDSFGQGMSAEVMVPVKIVQPEREYPNFVGNVGYAISFDGADDYLNRSSTPRNRDLLQEMTVMVWVKSTGAIIDGACVFSTSEMELSWSSFAGLGFHALLNADGSERQSMDSGLMLNDGMWHHLALAVTTFGQVILTVDGEAMDIGAVSNFAGFAMNAGYLVGKSTSSLGDGTDSFFLGQMDYFAVFDKALSTEDIEEYRFLILFPNTPRLISYLQFAYLDSLIEQTAYVLDVVDGTSVEVLGKPVVVTSTAPIVHPIYTMEDEVVLIDLLGPEFKGKNGIKVMITMAPDKGSLYEGGMMPISSVPYLIQNADNELMFVSSLHECGDESATPKWLYSSFNYLIHDNSTDVMSEEQTMVLAVECVNYAPVLTVPATAIELEDYAKKEVHLHGEDPDKEPVKFVITTLPTLGTLYTPDGKVVDESGFVLDEGIGMVHFMPVILDNKPLDVSTFFGYTVMDASNSLPTVGVAEAIVTFTISEHAVMPLVSGDPSYTLLFDGSAPLVVSSGAPVLTGSVTAEAWVKTSGGMTLSEMYIVSTPQFALYLRRITGVGFVVFGADGNTYAVDTPSDVAGTDSYASSSEPINDGYWHFVAGTYDHTVSTLKVYIDGMEKASLTEGSVGPLPVADDSYMLVGESFTGLIDELRVWSVSLVPEPYVPDAAYQWDPSGQYALRGDEAGLQAYFRFNEAAGNVATSSAGSAVVDVPEGAVWVPSAAPFGNKALTGEDQSVKIFLQGSSQQAIALAITAVPENGMLYQSNGSAIPFATTLVLNGTGEVVYIPDRHFHGNDSFAYVAVNVDTLERTVDVDVRTIRDLSMQTEVLISVTPINDPPIVTYYTTDAFSWNQEPVLLQMKGSDVEDEVSIHLLTLPARGHLYQLSGERIKSVPHPVSDPDGFVSYVPAPNGYGRPYDVVTFAAFDGESYSIEITMQIDVYADMALSLGPESPSFPVPGLGGAFAALAEKQDREGFSLEYWVKLVTDPEYLSKPGLGRRLAQSAETGMESFSYADFVTTPYTDVSSFRWALDLLVGELSIVPTNLADGQWHHVAFVLDEQAKTVFVDGHMSISQAVLVDEDAFGLVLEVFTLAMANSDTNTTLTNLLSGNGMELRVSELAELQTILLDELVLYAEPREAEAIRDSMRIAKFQFYGALDVPNQEDEFEYPEEVLYYNSFDVADTFSQDVSDSCHDECVRVPLNRPVVGEAGYSLGFSQASLVEVDGDTAFQLRNTGYTINMHFRTSEANMELGTLISKGVLLGADSPDGQYAIQWSPFYGLGFLVGATCGGPQQRIEVYSGRQYNDGAWHMVTATWNGSKATLQVDSDVMETNMAGACTVDPALTETYKVTLGHSANAADLVSHFVGEIDELRVFSTALTAEELTTRINNETTATDDLEVYYKFNEAVGDTIIPEVGGLEIVNVNALWVPSSLEFPDQLLFIGFEQDPRLIQLFGSDADGDQIKFVVTRVPERGALYTSNAAGDMLQQIFRPMVVIDSTHILYATGEEAATYTPANPNIYDVFAYSATDGKSMAVEAVFEVLVFDANKLPVADNLEVTTKEDTPLNIELSGTDEEGALAGARIVTLPRFGTFDQLIVDIDLDGAILVRYSPMLNYFGFDNFTYVLIDDQGAESEPAVVNIEVTAVNDAPVLSIPATMIMYSQSAALPPTMTVRDVDVGLGDMTLTVTASRGLVSFESIQAARTGQKTISYSGSEIDINFKLGNIYYYYVGAVPGASYNLQFTVTDQGNTGEGGPQQATQTMSVLVSDIPVVAVEFAPDGLGIRIEYQFATDRAGMNKYDRDCTMLLQSQSLPQFGEGSYCYWTQDDDGVLSDKEFFIQMGSGATIVPGDFIDTRADVMKFIGAAEFNPAYNLYVSAPPYAIFPVAIITGPSRFGRCEGVEAHGYLSSGDAGRLLTYEWRFYGGGQDLTSALVLGNAFDPGYDPLASRPLFNINPYTLVEDQTYTITLRVTNFLRKSSVVVSKDIHYDSQALPRLTIDALLDVTIIRSFPISYQAIAQQSSCNTGLDSNLVYRWEQTAAPMVELAGLNTSFLYIPKDTLRPLSGPYKWKVTVYDSAFPDAANFEEVTVNVQQQQIVAFVLGGDRSHPANMDLVLDASESYDPDDEGSMEYVWFCEFGSGDSASACQTRVGFDLELGTNSRLTYAANTLVAGSYLFSVAITTGVVNDTRSSVAYVTIVVSDDPMPYVQVTNYNKFKFNPRKKLTLRSETRSLNSDSTLSFAWTVAVEPLGYPCPYQIPECRKAGREIDLSDMVNVANTPTDAKNLQLKKSVLEPGTYKFRMTVSETTLGGAVYTGYAVMNVVVDEAPQGGVMQSIPTSGTELMDDHILKASGWKDHDTPLIYEFGFTDISGTYMALSSMTPTYFKSTRLPSTAEKVGMKVFDTFLVYNTAALTVSIRTLTEAGYTPEEIAALIDERILHIQQLLASGNADLVLAEVAIVQGLMNANPLLDYNDMTALTERRQQREQLIAIVIEASTFNNADPEKVALALLQTTYEPRELSKEAQRMIAAYLDSYAESVVLSGEGMTEELAQLYSNILSNLIKAGLNADFVGTDIEPFVVEIQMQLIDSCIRGVLLAVQMAPDAIPGVTLSFSTNNIQLGSLEKELALVSSTDTVLGTFDIPALNSARRSLLQNPFEETEIFAAWEFIPGGGDDRLTVAFNPRAYINYPVDMGGACGSLCPGPCLKNENWALYESGCEEVFSYVTKITADQPLEGGGVVDSVTRIPYEQTKISVEVTLRYDLSQVDDRVVPKCMKFADGVWEDTLTAVSERGVFGVDPVTAPFGKVECLAQVLGEYAVFAYVPPMPPPPPPTLPPPSPVIVVESPPPEVQESPPPAPVGTPSSKNEVPVAAIVGGVVGGVLFVLALGGAIILYRKRKHRTPVQSIEEHPLIGDDGMQPVKGQPSGAVRTQALLETE